MILSISNPSEVDDFEYDVELSDCDRSTPDSDDSKLKPAGTCENCQKAPCDHTIVRLYRTSFPVAFPFMTAKLLHIKFQVYGDDETVYIYIYDGFLGAEGACSTTAVCEGSVLKICHGHQNAFLMPQKEFKQSIATAGLVLIDDSLVFVIWKWHVLDVDEEDEDEKMSDLCELEADEEEENNESNSMDVVHALTFKCIGTTKEDRYQEILVEANLQRRSGKEVHVRLTPEPSNCYDSEAIAFECRTSAENRWERIGYI